MVAFFGGEKWTFYSGKYWNYITCNKNNPEHNFQHGQIQISEYTRNYFLMNGDHSVRNGALYLMCTKPRPQVMWANKFCIMVPNIYW